MTLKLVRWATTSAAVLVVAASAVSTIGAEPEMVTDRPDQTESATTVRPGFVQVETGWGYAREDEGTLSVRTHEVPGTLVRLGMRDPWELRIGWAGFIREETRLGGSETDADGVGDTSLGAKLRLAEERGRRPQLAALFDLTVPTGDDEVSSERLDPSFRLSAAHGLSERLALGYNLGIGWETEIDESGARDTLSDAFYTVALGIELSGRWGAFAELFGDVPLSATGGAANSFDGGFTYLLRDDLQFDVFGGFGLSNSAEDRFVGIGVSKRFRRR